MSPHLEAAAREKLLKARGALLLGQPFYGTLALYLETVAAETLPDGPLETMATDGRRLFYNPAFVDSLSDMELRGVLAHEIGHVVYKHGTRRNGRDAKQWNIAGDYAINRDLVKAGFKLPSCALLDSRFDGMTTDEIYSSLAAQQGKPKPAPGGAPSSGQGNGKPSPNGQPSGPGETGGQDPGGMGRVLDAAPEYDESGASQAESQWEARARQALAVAKAAGKLPGGIAGLIAELEAPRIDPAELFRRFIDESASRDYSWVRPNRRYLGAGLILPGSVPMRPSHIVAVVDTSGSTMGARESFAGFLQAALDDGAADRLTVVYADTMVQETAEYEPGDLLNLKTRGDGGTAFRQPLAWIGDNCPDASAIAYLTDCETTDWGDEPAAPVLWLVCGAPEYAKPAAALAPFGDSVLMME